MYKQLLMLLLLVNSVLCPNASMAVTCKDVEVQKDIEVQYEALKAAASRSGAWATVIKDNLEMTGTVASLTVASVEKLKKSLIKDQLNLLQEIAQKKYDLAGLVTSAEDIEKTINAAQGNSSIYTAIYEGNLTNVKKNMETATERLTLLAKEYQLKVAAGETADEIAEVAGDVTSSAGKLGKFMEVTGKFFDGLDIAVSLGEGGWHLIQGTSSKEDVDKVAATVVKVGFPAFGLYSAYSDITGMSDMLDQFYEDVQTRTQAYEEKFKELVKSAITDGEDFKELSRHHIAQFAGRKRIIETDLDVFLSGVQTVSIFAALNIVLSGKQEPYGAIIDSLKELLQNIRELDSDQLLFDSYAIGLQRGMYNRLKAFDEPAKNLSELEQLLNELIGIQEECDRKQSLAPYISSAPAMVFKPYQDATGQTISTFNPSGEINGDVSLEDGTLDLQGQELIINGNLIHSGGDLRVSRGRLVVKGDYRIQKPNDAGGYGTSAGVLLMIEPEDYVYVGGNFVTQSPYLTRFQSGYYGWIKVLTNGVLEVKGDFIQKREDDYATFEPFDSHKVMLSGTRLQTVTFDSPESSHFASLDITNTGEGVKFNSPLNALVLTTLGLHQLVPPVTLRVVDWNLTADETIAGDLYLEGAVLNLNDKQLTVEGNLIHSGGDLRVSRGRLIVKGDYRIQKSNDAGGYGTSAGVLLMTEPKDYVYVGGNFVTQSPYLTRFQSGYYGWIKALTNGILEVKGDFIQKRGDDYAIFEPFDSHKVMLSGTQLQTVSFDSPESSHFASLDITNSGEGIQFATRVVVSTLFNHRGHPFILSPSATPADFVDYDKDGLTDQVDPMPTSFNNLDTDQDGVVDELDAFPTDATEWADQDKDGIGDNMDDDNDNDGMTDAWEQVHGLNPADPNDANLPSTTEGLTNLQLFQQTQAILDSQPSFAFLGQATAKNTQGEAIVTEAKFIGGLATDQTKYRKTQTVKLSDPVTVAGLIAAETGHINQPAEIVVYAAYTPLSAPDSPPLYFMLDSNSGIQLWDENVNTLVAFQSVAALEDVAEIKMYQGPFPAAGFLKIYFGYRSPDGTVVVNGEPIEVKVTE